MSKLWEKGYTLDAVIEQFTVGEDPQLDSRLLVYDCLGSLAHAAMLTSIGILSSEEHQALADELRSIAQENKLPILPSDEDVHTAVENHLTKRLGAIGKKLHTARSRNDQILVDLRLYSKEQLLHGIKAATQLARVLRDFADRHQDVPLVGRTHMQPAMPSSVGLWAGAFAESLLDDVALLRGAYNLNDQCPLGSASSYGVPLAIDRELTAQLLGFSRVQNNVLYANNSRGKIEAATVHALAQLMTSLSKLAVDLMLFAYPEFGYFSLPETLCSGSSLMPQKRNPCGLELVRAKTATVASKLGELLEVIRPLPSGYHRDFQQTKEPLMQSFDIALGSCAVIERTLLSVEVNVAVCAAAFTPEVFATDMVLKMVANGTPFRDAYRAIAAHGATTVSQAPAACLKTRCHQGAPGNLGLESLTQDIAAEQKWCAQQQRNWKTTVQTLMEETDA